MGVVHLNADFVRQAQPVAVVVMAAAAGDVKSLTEESTGLAETLKSINARLEAHEKLSHFVVAKDPWTIENGFLTPTMKIKRNLLEKKYNDLIAKPVPKGGAVLFESATK